MPRMPTVPPPPPPRRLSALATTSVVLLLIPIVGPMASLLLGGLALMRIRDSAGRLRGRRLALAGLLGGGVLLIAQAWGLEALLGSVARGMDTRMREAATAIVAARDEESARAALGGWSGRAEERIGPEAIVRFAEEVRERYGELRGISTMSGDRDVAGPGQLVTFAVAFRFDGADRIGTVTTRLEPSVTELMPSARIVEIRLDDRERGELRLGAGPDGKEPRDGV